MSLGAFLKGWVGETIGSFTQALLLNPNDYKSLNNLTLITGNGTTQIDHVVVSRFGVFVVEDKTMDGWIFANPNDPSWTIVNWGNKYKIQNPIHQNFKHVHAVRDVLEIELGQVHSIIVFRGKCEFKTTTPQNVLTHGYVDYIQSFRELVFSNDQVEKLYSMLMLAAKEKSLRTNQEHVRSLQERFSSTTVCPKCGGKLTLRTAKNGPKAGSKFYGCSNYPKCHYVKKIEE